MENMENQNVDTVDTTETEDQERKTYTEDEMQSIIDRRVTQALNTQKKKFDKQLSLANLDEAAREKEQSRMRIEELEQQVAEFNSIKNRSEIKSVLSARNLPVEFADLMNIGDDYDAALKNLDVFDKAFKSAVANEVKRRLATSQPETGSSNMPTSLKGMSLKQQQELYNTNRDLYNKLAQNT